MSSPLKDRLALRANGYSQICLNGKNPAFGSWTNMRDAGEEHFRGWEIQHPRATNTGILTENTPLFDIDVRHPEAAQACEDAVRDWVGDDNTVLLRFGSPPKRAMPFQTSEPFGKISRKFRHPNDKPGDKPHGLEFLCAGQQGVVLGIHPDTGKEYSRYGGSPLTVPRSELPPIDAENARKLLDHCADILMQEFGFTEITANDRVDRIDSNGSENGGHRYEPLEALRQIQADGGDCNEKQPSIIMSLLQRGHHPDDVLKLIVDEVMEKADAANTGWTREEEVKRVNARIASALRKLNSEYDPASGEIPGWLPVEFHPEWEKTLTSGKRPSFQKNSYQWFVRGFPIPGAGGRSDHAGIQKVEPHFKLLRYCDLHPAMGGDDWCVTDLLPRVGLVVVWGKFKCLKTFWVFDLCLHIAKGWEYRDFPVKQGTVVYCAFEGAHGFGKRAEAQRIHYKLDPADDVPLRVMSMQVNLIKHHKQLIADIQTQLPEGKNPAVVVLDTLNRSLVGSESKDVDMAAYIAAAGAIREAFDCLVIIVHHCGWDETRPRGHSSLPGAIDGQLAVVREREKVSVVVELLRDGPEGTEIHSEAKPVTLGLDARGRDITSLVIVPSSQPARPYGGWPVSLIFFKRAVEVSLMNYGKLYQKGAFDTPTKVVELETVRQEFYATYIPKGRGDDDDPEKQRLAKNRAFNRCLNEALARGLLGQRQPEGQPRIVWIPPPIQPTEMR
jgi:hypothetical protein